MHIVKRGPMGNSCGYVGVPPGHPWHGQDRREINADVHGGITYTEPCHVGVVCHEPEPSEPEDLWWVGFDCGHAFDFKPGLDRELRGLGIRRGPAYVEPPANERWVERYRTMDYAKQQTVLLAFQAAREPRWIDYRAAQPARRREQHKTKAAIMLALRVKQRALLRQRRKRIQQLKREGWQL